MNKELDALFDYVVTKRMEYEEMLDVWNPRRDEAIVAIDVLEDIENKIRELS